jgi:hypothetical protein
MKFTCKQLNDAVDASRPRPRKHDTDLEVADSMLVSESVDMNCSCYYNEQREFIFHHKISGKFYSAIRLADQNEDIHGPLWMGNSPLWQTARYESEFIFCNEVKPIIEMVEVTRWVKC